VAIARFRLSWVAVVAAALLLTLRPAGAQDASVSLANFAFVPSSVTIGVGDTVTWTHNDPGVPHTVTSTDGGPLSSGTLNQGQTFAFTFDTAGTYAYTCAFHPTMTGTVVVQAAAEPTPTPTPPATPTGLPASPTPTLTPVPGTPSPTPTLSPTPVAETPTPTVPPQPTPTPTMPTEPTPTSTPTVAPPPTGSGGAGPSDGAGWRLVVIALGVVLLGAGTVAVRLTRRA
jgi:plastocyanin